MFFDAMMDDSSRATYLLPIVSLTVCHLECMFHGLACFLDMAGFDGALVTLEIAASPPAACHFNIPLVLKHLWTFAPCLPIAQLPSFSWCQFRLSCVQIKQFLYGVYQLIRCESFCLCLFEPEFLISETTSR